MFRGLSDNSNGFESSSNWTDIKVNRREVIAVMSGALLARCRCLAQRCPLHEINATAYGTKLQRNRVALTLLPYMVLPQTDTVAERSKYSYCEGYPQVFTDIFPPDTSGIQLRDTASYHGPVNTTISDSVVLIAFIVTLLIT